MDEHVHDAVRIAATIYASAVALEMEGVAAYFSAPAAG